MPNRAPKQNPTARCCWVCGKLGGEGFTRALRYAGYPVGKDQMAYAHAACMIRANKRANKRAHPAGPLQTKGEHQ
jgi:hypothetical protein